MDSEYPDDGTVPAEQPHKGLRGPHLFLCKTKSNHVHWFFTSCRMNSLFAFQALVCYNANLPSACFVVCEVPSLQ